jgi:fumarate reductase subunit C
MIFFLRYISLFGLLSHAKTFLPILPKKKKIKHKKGKKKKKNEIHFFICTNLKMPLVNTIFGYSVATEF